MARRFIAVAFVIAMLFSVAIAPASAHKKVECETVTLPISGNTVIQVTNCECVEHEHGGELVGG